VDLIDSLAYAIIEKEQDIMRLKAGSAGREEKVV